MEIQQIGVVLGRSSPCKYVNAPSIRGQQATSGALGHKISSLGRLGCLKSCPTSQSGKSWAHTTHKQKETTNNPQATTHKQQAVPSAIKYHFSAALNLVQRLNQPFG